MNTQSYRFAFVGVTSSGKTCILGRLAQQADADNRYSSTLVQPTQDIDETSNTTNSDEENENEIDSESAIALKGYIKIKDAQKALESSQCPEATQTQETGRLLVTFDMTDSNRGDFRVCTEDYSGELINEELLLESTSLASELKQKLSEYDGLIFVVETLAEGDDVSQAKVYIQNLCRFFSAIKDCMSQEKWESTPLAIIFSKWDKYSPTIDYENPESEESKLESYLKTYPFYNNLVKRIRAVTNIQDSLSELDSEQSETTNSERSEKEKTKANIIEQNTKNFPVSAFGKSIVVDGKYRPDKDAPAFGIVAPFAWMVQRLDDLNRIELEQKSKSYWNWIYAFGLWHNSHQVAKRIPKKTEDGKAVRRIRTKAAVLSFINAVSYVLLVWLFFFTATYLSDRHALNQYKKVVETQSSSEPDIQEAQDKVWGYVNSSLRKNVSFLRSTSHVVRAIQKIMGERDELLWSTVSNAKTIVLKYDAALLYMQRLPNGKHKPEAENIILTYERQVQEDDYQNILACKDKPKECIPLCHTFIEKYKTGAIVDKVKNLLTTLNTHLDKQEKINVYRSLYTGTDFEYLIDQLVTLIGQYTVTDKDIENLISEFPDIFKEMIQKKCKGKYDADIITTYKSGLQKIDTLLVHVNGNEAILTTKKFLDGLIQKQIKTMDHNLYQFVLTNSSLTNIDNYINKMKEYGGGVMLKYVSTYKQWLLSQNEEKTYTVRISMKWGSETPNRLTRAKIWLDDMTKEKYNEKDVTINSKLEKTITELSIKKKLGSDSLFIRASFVGEGNWTPYTNDYVFGQGEKTVKVQSLLNGVEIPLPDKTSSGQTGVGGYEGTLFLKIIDAPPKPVLPQWKN